MSEIAYPPAAVEEAAGSRGTGHSILYVVVPGNVGGADTLLDVVAGLGIRRASAT